jgi:ubiquinol-cytochrome c reductase subunit 6
MSEDQKAIQPTDAEEEEEMVDPLQKLRDNCAAKAECTALAEKMNACNDRVNSKSATTETCLEELIDYMHCVDHCANKKLFNFLK